MVPYGVKLLAVGHLSMLSTTGKNNCPHLKICTYNVGKCQIANPSYLFVGITLEQA